MLRNFRNKNQIKFKNEDLKKYQKFKDILEDFKKVFHLEKYSLKEIDKYLWQAGKFYMPKKYNLNLKQ